MPVIPASDPIHPPMIRAHSRSVRSVRAGLESSMTLPLSLLCCLWLVGWERAVAVVGCNPHYRPFRPVGRMEPSGAAAPGRYEYCTLTALPVNPQVSPRAAGAPP